MNDPNNFVGPPNPCRKRIARFLSGNPLRVPGSNPLRFITCRAPLKSQRLVRRGPLASRVTGELRCWGAPLLPEHFNARRWKTRLRGPARFGVDHISNLVVREHVLVIFRGIFGLAKFLEQFPADHGIESYQGLVLAQMSDSTEQVECKPLPENGARCQELTCHV